MNLIKDLSNAVIEGNSELSVSIAKNIISQGLDINDAIFKGLNEGMRIVSDLYAKREYFLPDDKNEKILGLPNRWVMAIGFSLFCVVVEIFLNWGNYLIWEYVWWNWYNPVLIFFIGYFHFFVGAFYVYDLPELKDKIKVVGIIYGVGIVLLCIFGPLFGDLGIF